MTGHFVFNTDLDQAKVLVFMINNSVLTLNYQSLSLENSQVELKFKTNGVKRVTENKKIKTLPESVKGTANSVVPALDHNIASFQGTIASTPLPSTEFTASERSIDKALGGLEIAERNNVEPEQAIHVKKSFLKSFKKGNVKEAIKLAYDNLPDGVVPKVIGGTLATIGFIAGTVACAATGGTAPLIAATVFAGINAALGAGDALRAYKTRNNKEKPFANDSLGYLINRVCGDKHRKMSNGISSGLRVGLFMGAIAAFAANTATASSDIGHSVAASGSDVSHSTVAAPHWTHATEGATLVLEAAASKIELSQSEREHNINGHSQHDESGNNKMESTNL